MGPHSKENRRKYNARRKKAKRNLFILKENFWLKPSNNTAVTNHIDSDSISSEVCSFTSSSNGDSSFNISGIHPLSQSSESYIDSKHISGYSPKSNTLTNCSSSLGYSPKSNTHTNCSSSSGYSPKSNTHTNCSSSSGYSPKSKSSSRQHPASINNLRTCLEHGELCGSRHCKYRYVTPEIYNDPLFLGLREKITLEHRLKKIKSNKSPFTKNA